MRRLIFVFIFIGTGIAVLAQSLVPSNSHYDAPTGLFDPDSLRSLTIEFYDPNYHDILVQGWYNKSGERLPAKITLSNGLVMDSVAIRYKGNSTFQSAEEDGNRKLPWNIDINYYDDDQRLMGYPKLKLANARFDPSFVREMSAYHIYRNYLPSGESNFIDVYVDDEFLGVYVNTESVDKNFLKKHFGNSNGVLFKCDPSSQFGEDNGNFTSNLVYLGPDTSAYQTHYTLKSDHGWASMVELCRVLEESPEELPNVLNIDRVLWAFAVNMVVSNLDTYNGLFRHNYYLYQHEDGLFQMIPWDLSMSYISLFLIFTWNPDQLYEYDPFNGYGSVNTPLVRRLISDPQSLYGKIYAAHIRTILEEQMDPQILKATLDEYQDLIRSSVFQDSYKLFPNGEFSNNVTNDLIIPFVFSSAGIIPTVQRRNSFLKDHPEIALDPPSIESVLQTEISEVLIEAGLSNATHAELLYSSNGYHSKFDAILMNDEGLDGDKVAGDGIHSAILPTESTITDYYIRAHNEKAIALSPARAEYEFYQYRRSSHLVINELMADNEAWVTDAEGEYEDWIELFNAGDQNINLSDYFLSDKGDQLDQWRLPDSNLAPGDYQIIWCDGDEDQGLFHSSFKLSKGGETVFLSDLDGNTVDKVSFSSLGPDESFGLFPNGTGQAQSLWPTFNDTNALVSQTDDQNSAKTAIHVHPNPAFDTLYLQKEKAASIRSLSISDSVGRQMWSIDDPFKSTDSMQLDISSWPAGMYWLHIDADQTPSTKRSFIKSN